MTLWMGYAPYSTRVLYRSATVASNCTVRAYPVIEVFHFWIAPGRCITWEMGGSQFTMTLCTGLGQTPEIENGYVQ